MVAAVPDVLLLLLLLVVVVVGVGVGVGVDDSVVVEVDASLLDDSGDADVDVDVGVASEVPTDTDRDAVGTLSGPVPSCSLGSTKIRPSTESVALADIETDSPTLTAASEEDASFERRWRYWRSAVPGRTCACACGTADAVRTAKAHDARRV
ncbi:hypothetical protein SYNPS1DRAFT_30725 [Syncephalis pseudoplumigaleata]|uniref:Secreted protein n=1 Tax=Syncephalis pseudoplumigaleata TaxID=1712513 RepID=A0A4P9YUK8_9FUNG|nr:hypothetical protein SYNPS1DRAFT_30725 [Syncephalis pseudoplumigaleata]|eukprot:RKP23524.1 hypothetical protein SYNPS1DRAFT_30725 [Syncephalis pseudoplumigaleata]